MTAEIGIGNQAGIVLAADSAVSETNYNGQVQAIYNSAQKLYTLGWQHYVGLLLYGTASYEGTPWSVLFNRFKHYVGEKRLDAIETYQLAFLQYLEEEPELNLAVTDESSTINQVVSSLTYTLCRGFQIGDHNSDELANYVEKQLNDFSEQYYQGTGQHYAADNYPEETFQQDYFQALLQINPGDLSREGLIIKLMKDQAKQINIELSSDNNYHDLFTDHMKEVWLHTIYIILFYGLSSGQWKGVNVSGIVIAGYGKRNIWPVVKQLNIYGYVHGHPIYTSMKIDQIGGKMANEQTVRSLFLPFAQTDVANTLRTGISDDIYNQLYDTIMNKTAPSKEAKERILQQINNYFFSNYRIPFETEIAMLNVPELAEIAETMIKVTSFERQYNGDHYATVGGPIDVLAITPGDGPVWIHKKHYFDPNNRDNLGWQLRLQRGI